LGPQQHASPGRWSWRPNISNQYIITNGYENREGLEGVLGVAGGSMGSLGILQLHESFNKVSLNLHISGTLLEAILWHYPDHFAYLRSLKNRGVLDLVGSYYGQNIMRFFNDEHNFRQLNEETERYQKHFRLRLF
jgi:hypothetical protein